MPGTRALPVLLLALVVLPGAARAQAEPGPWSFQAEMGFNGASGNSSFSILRTGLRAVRLEAGVSELEASALLRYGRSDGKVIADDRKASLKLDLWPGSRLSPFVFADASSDAIRRLDARSSGGAGAKLLLWSSPAGKASVSAAALWDYQDFAAGPDGPTPPSESLARWSVRTRLDRKLSPSATFEHVALWQPVWDDGGDYVLDVTHTVSTQVIGRVTLALEHQYLRDANPPPGVEPADQRFSVLLKMAF